MAKSTKKPSLANAKPTKPTKAIQEKPVLTGPQEYDPSKEYVIEKGRRADEWHAPMLLRVPDAFRDAISEYLTDEETGEMEMSRSQFIVETIAKKIGYDGPLSAPKEEKPAKAPKAKKEPKAKVAKEPKAKKAPKAKKQDFSAAEEAMAKAEAKAAKKAKKQEVAAPTSIEDMLAP